MNFFNLLSAGTNLFNFNLANLTSFSSSQPQINTTITKPPSNQSQFSIEKDQPIQHQACLGIPQEDRAEVFAHQQQLINQYMHLNIQLLSKKLENLQQEKQVNAQVEEDNDRQARNTKKKIKKINTCGHPDRQHYAKGMCNNCYHRFGRNKKPWNCPHSKLYANGMCQNCYINNYNKKRREARPDEQMPLESLDKQQFIEKEIGLGVQAADKVQSAQVKKEEE